MQQTTEPPQSGINRINDELAVGYDLEFEKTWWHLELGLWALLSVIIALALVGLLGNGPLAHRNLGTADSQLQVKYQRVSRYMSPDILDIRVAPALFRNGEAHIWVNRAIISELGTQRVIPQPARSMPSDNGIEYIFPVGDPQQPMTIALELQATAPGRFHAEVRVDPAHDLFFSSIVLP